MARSDVPFLTRELPPAQLRRVNVDLTGLENLSNQLGLVQCLSLNCKMVRISSRGRLLCFLHQS